MNGRPGKTSPEVRSAVMSRIRGKGTRPEMLLASAMHRAGLRFRKNVTIHTRTRPDIVHAGRKIAIFVDGCFWHGCPDHYVRPRSRTEFWAAKLRENVERDIRQTRELTDLGWTVLRFWEHEVWTEMDEALKLIRVAWSGQVPCNSVAERVIKVAPLDEDGQREVRYLVVLTDRDSRRRIEGVRSTAKW